MKFEVTRTATEVITIDLPSVTSIPDNEYDDTERDNFFEAIRNMANHIDVQHWCTVESDLNVAVLK